ncbi:MAG: hypothetical protein OEV42_09740 [Deltaproteobacteria bacterium]|nr:hypothetical protein [Deltaproteobacteria bacterium]
MKNFLQRILNGATYGIGFSLVFVAVMHLYITHLKEQVEEQGYSDYPEELKEEYYSDILVETLQFFMVEGQISIIGKVTNKTPVDLLQVNVAASVEYEGKPIEKCTALAEGYIKSGGSTKVTIYCSDHWDSVDPKKLSAQYRPSNVYLAYE